MIVYIISIYVIKVYEKGLKILLFYVKGKL